MSWSKSMVAAVMAALVTAALTAACSSPRPEWADRAPGVAGAAPAAAASSAGVPASAAGPAAVAPPSLAGPQAQRELSFEDGDPPAGWSVRGPHRAAVADAQVVHGGARSLRIDAAGEGRAFTALSRVIAVDEVRGKRVRLAAWLRTDALDGELGLWLRADGAAGARPVAFGGTHATPVTGTSDWVRREATVEVPADAAAFVLGAFVSGAGTAWIDDVEVAITDGLAGRAIAVRGQVVDAAGRPAAGATVAAVSPTSSRPTAVVTADADGRYTLELPAGRWGFTATSPAGAAAYEDVRELAGPAAIELRLGDGGITVQADVRVAGPRPADLRVLAIRASTFEGDIFAAAVGADGRAVLRLPTAGSYTLLADGGGVSSEPQTIAGDVDRTVALVAGVAGPAPEDVVGWLRAAAAPLAGAAPGGGTDDLRPLSAAIGGARLIALGEASHGTREFFQLKHRALEYLVEHEGVRWFAIEANQPEARKVDDYVLTGAGSAAEALAGLYFWTWDTEEVLAMIEWMRAYNADPRHADKLRFTGFDMQTTKVAWPAAAAYLARVDPAYAKALPARLARFAEDGLGQRWRSLPADERAALRADLAAVLARFDRERARWSKAGGADGWAIARQDVRVVEQAAAMFDAGDAGGFEARDRAMADNVDWLLARAGAGARIVLWAHNGHIARVRAGLVNMGSLLAARHGDDYRPIGFVFADGGFQAIPAGGGGLQAFTVGPPAAGDVASAFLRAGLEVAFVDLRAAPAGPVAGWLAAPHPMRELGAVFLDEASLAQPQRLTAAFDAVFFVAHTTRARPNPSGTR